MLTWLDVIAILVLSLAVALGYRHGLPFTLAVVPALVAYFLLASYLPSSYFPLLALVLGLGAGAIFQMIPLPRLSMTADGFAGAIGGLAWGLFLAFTIWVSFPSQYMASAGNYRYPSAKLPLSVQRAVYESKFAPSLFTWALHQPLARKILLPHVRK